MDPDKVGARRMGAQSGGRKGVRRVGAEGWGPKGGEPKVSRFFFLFPPPFRSFCVSLVVFSWNFGGV